MSIRGLKQNLFRDALSISPAVTWLHSFILLHLKANKFAVANHAELQIANNEVSRRVHALGAAVVVEDLRAHCLQVAGDASVITSILAWDKKFELEIRKLSPEELQKTLPSHFSFRTRFSPDLMWQQIENDARFEALRYLHTHASSFDSTYCNTIYMVQILNYTGDLMKLCDSRQMTRECARNTTLGTMVSENPALLGGKRFESYCKALKKTYRGVLHFVCKNKTQLDLLFGGLQFNESMPLIFLLPGDNNESLFIPALFLGREGDETQDWHALGLVHTDAVQTLSKGSWEPPSAEHRPYGLVINDMIVFDEQHDILDYWPLYFDNCSVLHVTEDLINLQWQVVQSSKVRGKPIIKGSLPEFEFQEDKSKSVFFKLNQYFNDVVEFPRKEIQSHIIAATNKNPAFASSCMAYLIFIAGEIITRPRALIPKRLDQFANSILVPMTDVQLEGKEFLSSPGFVRDLCPQHVLAISAMIWSGDVIPSAAVPLSEDLHMELDVQMELIKCDLGLQAAAPFLRLAIRLIGIRFLCSSIEEATLACNLYDMVDGLGSTMRMLHWKSYYPC